MTRPLADRASPAELTEEARVVERLRGLREQVTTQMGGPEAVRAIHAAGGLTAREHIAEFVDPGSFLEIGTFATFVDKVTVPDPGPYGGGIIGGQATLDGRPVTVAVDDDSVIAPARRSTGKAARLYQMALKQRHPYIEIIRGDAVPDLADRPGKTGTQSARTFGAEPAFPYLLGRQRAIPVACMVLGDTAGAASFSAGLCDFLVQLEGTRLSLARQAPAGADGPDGPDGAAASGAVDAVVGSPDEAYAVTRRFLSYLPSYADGPLPVTGADVPLDYDHQLAQLVPARRSRAYDMKAVIRRICDEGSFFELKPSYARNIVTGFGRLGGIPIGVLANAPMRMAGGLTPECCLKAVSFVCLCDGFGVPMLVLQDTPGFLVSAQAERDRAIVRVMALLQAMSLITVPTVSVVVRKAFGLAFLILDGNRAVDLSLAWPGAEIGFMDPPVAANVLFEPQIRELPPEERPAFLAAKAAELGVGFEPYGVAANLTIDDIIEPGATRSVVARYLRMALASRPPRAAPSPLASWPCWY
ncbi:MAG TPA: carboxyl transferase domain-containing protein [Streptosporangiaceae bacterium]|nr:carboxyl transferase domain-containing protein [Streptosporangiaceae bacterium]